MHAAGHYPCNGETGCYHSIQPPREDVPEQLQRGAFTLVGPLLADRTPAQRSSGTSERAVFHRCWSRDRELVITMTSKTLRRCSTSDPGRGFGPVEDIRGVVSPWVKLW